MSMSDSNSENSIITQENQYEEEKQQKRALRKAQKELLDLMNAPAIKAERDLHVEELVADEEEEDSSDAMSVLTQEEDFLAQLPNSKTTKDKLRSKSSSDEYFIKNLVVYMTELTKVDN